MYIPGKQKFNEVDDIPGPGMYSHHYKNIGFDSHSRKTSLHKRSKNIDGKYL